MFEYHVTAEDRSEPVVEVSGNLDMDATLRLEPAVDKLLAVGPSVLTIDMSRLTFMDSTGLGMLVELHEHARREGVELRLERPPHGVGRVIELTGLDTVLPLV
jgi:anti-sigma B factor antagonist